MNRAFILFSVLLSAESLLPVKPSVLCRDSCSEFGPWTLSLYEPNKPCRCLKYGGYRILVTENCSRFQQCLESCDAVSFDHAFCINHKCICANTYALFVASSRIKRKSCIQGNTDCRTWCRRRGFRIGWCSPEQLCTCLPYKRSSPISLSAESIFDGCIIPPNICGRVCRTLGFEGGFCVHKTCTCSQAMKNSFQVTYVNKGACELNPYQCILKCAFVFHQKATCVGSKCVCLDPYNHPFAFKMVNDESFRGFCHVPHNYCFRMCLDLGYADGYCTKTVCECLLGRKSKTINLLDESTCVRAKDICRDLCSEEQFLNDACYDTDCVCYTGSSYLIKRLQPSMCFIPETFCRDLCKIRKGQRSRFSCEPTACVCSDGISQDLTITRMTKCNMPPADCHTQCQLDGFHRSFCSEEICSCLDNNNIYYMSKAVTTAAEYRRCEVPIRYCRHFCQKQGFVLGTCEGTRCLCVPENGIFELEHRASCQLPENRCELGCSERSYPKAFCVQKHCLCTTNPDGPFEIKF